MTGPELTHTMLGVAVATGHPKAHQILPWIAWLIQGAEAMADLGTLQRYRTRQVTFAVGGTWYRLRFKHVSSTMGGVELVQGFRDSKVFATFRTFDEVTGFLHSALLVRKPKQVAA